MEFCYNNNKTLFITTGVGAVVSFITNIWFIYNLKCKKTCRKFHNSVIWLSELPFYKIIN